MSDVPERWVEMFGEGWHSVPEGQPGDRRRAGLALVLDDLSRQIEEAQRSAGIDFDGPWMALSWVLALLEEGAIDD